MSKSVLWLSETSQTENSKLWADNIIPKSNLASPHEL